MTTPLLLPIGQTEKDGVRGYLGGISRTRVYSLVNSGDLKAIKMGRRTLITRESAEALVARLKGVA